MIEYFSRHPIAANLFLLAGLFLGAISITGMERESFPEFSASSVSVSVVYPGASAQDVDEEICLILDDTLQAITDLDEFTCQSVASRATARLTMSEGGDISQFFNDISSEVAAVSDLPEDAEEPSVAIDARTERVALLAVSGLASDNALVTYADQLAEDLANLRGIATADVQGISSLEYRISLDDFALRRYGLSPRDVADAISQRSTQSPLGVVETNGEDLSLRLKDVRRSVPSLQSLTVIEQGDGRIVRLSDVAEISLTLADPALRSEMDGAQAAIISLAKSKSDDAIEAYAAVEAEIQKIEARYGGKLQIQVINNSTEQISDQIELVLENAAISLVLVIAITCLFFSLRDAIWISLALPFSFLLALFVMSAIGVTINMMSLLALLISIGLIMDDSIVIAENIASWRDTLPAKEAAVRGTKEVMSGVLSSFLTTAGVFGPLMFLSGEIGAILQVVPIVLLITLAASLVEAFLILPHHMAHVPNGAKPSNLRLVPRLTQALANKIVVPLVERLTEWRYLTLGSVLGLLILTIALIPAGIVRVVGFPESEADTIEARIALVAGSQVDRTQAAVDSLLAGLRTVDADFTPGTNGAEALVERVLVQYGQNADASSNGEHTATIVVDILTADERNVTTSQLLSAWKAASGPIPDVSQLNFTSAQAGPGGSDLDISLFSRDLGELEAASAALLSRLSVRPDVTTAYTDFTAGQTEIQLSLTAYGRSLGLTPSGLANQLRTAFTGTETDSFIDGATSYEVVVEQPKVAQTVADLRAFPITLAGGTSVALSVVADLQTSKTLSQITREKGLARARVVGNINRTMQTPAGISAIAVDEIGPDITAEFPSVSLSIGGSTEEQTETQASIFSALSIGLVVIYIVLAFQFRSYTLPVFIMLSIPFALIGSILGHLVMGMDMSMPSFIGFASLAGVVVNNAILFVSFFEANAKDGDHVKAAVEAVRRRFRPVVLSSMTTFIGLLPVVFETSPSVVTIVPVVVSVAFGVLASMLLVIFVFPAVLAIYFDFANVSRWVRSAELYDTPEVAADTA
ncbi:efflux RND transporter permease subunit [Algirhabdus cladophorae]|uniref:efflux RND transporter permease subunit n=1 Tax=Algirhabdus cladophorae TaxID=3377108 RepID=UPI003B847C89